MAQSSILLNRTFLRGLTGIRVANRGASCKMSREIGPGAFLQFSHNSVALASRSLMKQSQEVELRSAVLKAFCSTASTSTSKKEEGSDKSDAQAQRQEEAEGQMTEKEAQLMQQVEQLQFKHDDLLDKYRRSLAESDNMRKRLTKQIEDAKTFGIQSFCKDLLEVADVLNKAVSDVPAEMLEKESQYLRDIHQGLQLTESQLLQVFRRHGLEKVSPELGEKFDPNVHEALFQVPATAEMESGTIMDVQKVGYALHGRTVRPVLVGVAVKK